jgi:hypothetical protein
MFNWASRRRSDERSVCLINIRIPLLVLAVLACATAQTFREGTISSYRHERDGGLRGSIVKSFTLSVGKLERSSAGNFQWISLAARKANGEQFRTWLLSTEYPPMSLEAARKTTARYIVQEGTDRPREYRNPVTKEAVIPSSGAWEYLFPRPVDSASLVRVRYIGHTYLRESLTEGSAVQPPEAKVIELRPDLLVGPASNTRQKDETRRYDGSDYELVRLTERDYREMADAGVSCVRVDAEQALWVDKLNMYYWGDGGKLPYPELLYRSQYLGPSLYLDEPAVTTRDYEIRPRLAKDEEFRKSLTPRAAFDFFRGHFAKVLQQHSSAMVKSLAARPDVDVGSMDFAQANLYSWDTMVSTAAHQLSQHPRIPEAMVFEPPGRIGTRRTLPEIDMTYGVQIPPDDPKALPSIIFGFLRGAARLTNKGWGVSIYGAVQQADTFWWLTHAYDLGATRFHFYDSYQLACVPYGEYLALARHLRNHARSNPVRDLDRLRRAAEVAILLPVGYNLGHVFLGKGPLWGVGELNLERLNPAGVKYRVVMSNFFQEIERCLQQGIAFDLVWDMPDMRLTGYREIVRIREDGKVEVEADGKHTLMGSPRAVKRKGGTPPDLRVTISSKPEPDALEIIARARIVEKSAPVYYTLGADTEGVYHNAKVAWELYGPGDEDYLFLRPDHLKPSVREIAGEAEVEATVRVSRPGSYRLRASTVDTMGRTTVVWRPFRVAVDRETNALRLQEPSKSR